MRIPDSLADLADQGVIDRVIRPLKSGKEALVYLVEVDGGACVAKVYKQADHRTFKHRSEYTEGRAVRNTRDQRAMAKRTTYGQKKDDEAWRCAEVDAMYRLQAVGVRVPEPYHFAEDVLLMELVVDAHGNPAPRLSEAAMSRPHAQAVFDQLLAEAVRMLSAGVVHGDLSEFNILMSADGPVIIDFPQWVDAARNQNARQLLIRDLDNLTRFLRRFDPKLKRRPYGEELWQCYERSELTRDTKLTGDYVAPVGTVDLARLADEIRDAEEAYRRERGSRATEPKRKSRPAQTPRPANKPKKAAPEPVQQVAEPEAAPKKRRKRPRRRRRKANETSGSSAARTEPRKTRPPRR